MNPMLHSGEISCSTKSEQPVSWRDPDGTINLRCFVDIVDKLENQALRVALFKLKNAATIDDDHLLMCCSPGVMWAIVAALPRPRRSATKRIKQTFYLKRRWSLTCGDA